MFEWAPIFVSCGLMYKIADMDRDASPLIWTIVTFIICFACLFIPLPFLRILIGAILSIVALVAYKAISR